jgi:hypothetical protein
MHHYLLNIIVGCNSWVRLKISMVRSIYNNASYYGATPTTAIIACVMDLILDINLIRNSLFIYFNSVYKKSL